MRNLLFIILIVVVLSGCSNFQSEEKAVANAVDKAKEIFQDETPVNVNYEAEDFPLYVPKRFDINSADEHNVILQDGDQKYIVFYNELEDSRSKLHYNEAKTIGTLAFEAFEDEGKFGYIRIMPDEGEGYEIQVGIGGVKITTLTKKGNMEKDAEEMMNIAKSIVANS